jgi:hypothetical protein
MKLKPAFLLAAGAIALAVVTLAPTSAKNAYRLQAQEQYKLVAADGKGQIGCVYCHVAPSGGSNWNKYGNELRTLYFGDAKRDIAQALYLVLKADKDSDGDGFKDALEIIAKTEPGNEKSKPTKTVAALEAELKAAGGVDAFKPKK